MRLTATVCLLVAASLAIAGLLVYVVQSQRVDEQTNAAVEQELQEFAQLADGTNPDTRKQWENPQQLFRRYLASNVPDTDELLVGWVDDGRDLISLTAARRDIATTTEFAAAVEGHLGDGGSERLSVPDYGEVLITVAPVAVGETADPGDAMVVVIFLDTTRAPLVATMKTYTVIAALLLLIVTGVAWWRSGRLLAPLRDLRETAADITTSDLTSRLPERGNDDITALTRTFNDMLDRLEAGVTSQRQFLDDAGHELRTPLTILRGHLELLDTGEPAEIGQTRTLLLDEVDRMSRLVGDLIVLAKTRRPDFLAPLPTEIGGLTHEVLTKARGLGDRRWVLDNVVEAEAVLDPQRITQAMLQLSDNAVKHTDDGAEIGLGSDLVDSGGQRQLRLWVRDTGDGIPPSDRDRIFDRFGRSTVREGDEGFGLGLSIVQAIASGHDGTVELVDADEGAWFVIALPYRPPDNEHLQSPSDYPTEREPWPTS